VPQVSDAVSVAAVTLAVMEEGGSVSHAVRDHPKRARAPVARFRAEASRRPNINKGACRPASTCDGTAACSEGIPTAPAAEEDEPTGAPRSFGVGACVRSLKHDAHKGEIGQVEAVACGWIKVRMGEKIVPFRRKELKHLPVGLAPSSARPAVALGGSNSAVPNATASAPLAVAGGCFVAR